MAEFTGSDTVENLISLHVPRYRKAFEDTAALRDAIPEERVKPVNFEIYMCVQMITGNIKETRKLIPSCLDQLPKMDLVHFERLETSALALGYAHGLFLGSVAHSLSIQEISARLLVKRDLMESNCITLMKHDLLDANSLKELKGPVGYRQQVSDVMLMIGVLRQSWPKLAGKTALTPADLDEGEVLADALLTSLGERAQQPAATAAAGETRDRAFTLFSQSYRAIRRAAKYLRDDFDDTDKFIAAIYAKKRKPGSADSAEEDDTEEASANTTAPAVTAPVVPATATIPNSASTAVGMPGSNPFVSGTRV